MSPLRIATAVVAVLMTTAACSSDSDAPSSDPTTSTSPASFAKPVKGLPGGVDENPAGTPGAGLTDDGQLWIVTFGSSSNPLAVDEVSADGQTVTVTLTQNDGPATMDLVPTTSTVALPDGVDPAEPISVTLTGFGTVDLDPSAPGTMVWLPAQ